MQKYLLLLRGGDFKDYSDEEMKEIVAKYVAWTDKLKRDGVHIASEPLKSGGRVLHMENDKIVDGPFTETKEAVGGFYLIKAENYDAAAKLSKECPHLSFNGIIELREISNLS